MKKLSFRICEKSWDSPTSGEMLAVLGYDNWNDYGFYTAYELSIFDGEGNKHDIGPVRIASTAMSEKENRVILPDSPFGFLDDTYFSLGGNLEYYKNIRKLDDDLREALLRAVRDMAFDLSIFYLNRDAPVTQQALLRSASESTVIHQYHRVATGGVILTPFNFKFSIPTPNKNTFYELEFKVDPSSPTPPTNLHAIIGRNGTGKTFALRSIAESAIQAQVPFRWERDENRPDAESVSALVCVSFSPFDPIHLATFPVTDTMSFPIDRVSLQERTSDDTSRTKTPEDLTEEFKSSIKECAERGRYGRWQKAIRNLETDPGFADLQIPQIELLDRNMADANELGIAFSRLSSGHKIVLLTLTRLVETIAEKSLILIDEPETHLHPPLLSSFIRTLSSLMLDWNAVAVLATHSPVVLQELPKSCVSKLERSGDEIDAYRPDIETFGENIGTLTREVFSFEVINSGFQGLLAKVANESEDYEEASKKFQEQLGAEARAILHSLMVRKRKGKNA